MLFNSLEQLKNMMKEFQTGGDMDYLVHNVCWQIQANEKTNNSSESPDKQVMKVK